MESLNAKYIWVNQKTCSGCRTCEIICSEAHFDVFNPKRSAIWVERNYGGSGDWQITHTCRQCLNAWCMQVCPTQSISRNPKTGAVVVNRETCIGCGSCEKNCPFGMIHVLDIAGENKSFKCDLCGGDPECVKHCPNDALKMKLVKVNSKSLEVFP